MVAMLALLPTEYVCCFANHKGSEELRVKNEE